MSSYNPPREIVPIFDSSLFVEDTGTGTGITQADADLRYLKFPSAQGTENLQATNITGALTVLGNTLINSTGSANTTIGGATTAINGTTVGITSTSTLNLALGATSILNVGIVGRTNINADHHYSDGNSCIAGANVHFNNGTKNQSTTRIQDGNGEAVGDSTGGVNILTGNFNTGTVAIGQYTNNIDNKTTTTIAGDLNLSTTGGNVIMGSTTNTSTTINGGIIKQVVPVYGGGSIAIAYGNSTSSTSLTTTFNRKITESMTPQNCYTITINDNFTAQYFEIFVSGSNSTTGGYTYKGCFGIQRNLDIMSTSAVNTMFNFGGIIGNLLPVINLTIVGFVVTVSVDTSLLSGNQRFFTSLIAYPSLRLNGDLFNCSVTAI